MSSDGNKNERLVNQSHVVYSSGSSSYTTYSNTVGIPILGPLIKVEKSTEEREAVPGRPIAYKAVVRNKGNFPAKVVLYDELPDGMAFVPNSVVKNGVPIPGADLEDGMKLGVMEPGDKTQVDFRVVLLPEREEKCGKYVRNRMKAKVVYNSSNGRRVKEVVHSNTVKLPVAKADKPVPYAKLSVEPGCAAPGDRLRYTLLVGNDGHAAANVTLLSFIPKGTTYVPNSFTLNGKWINIGIPAKSGVPIGLIEPGERVTASWEVAVPGVSIVTPGQTIEIRALLAASYRAKGGGEQVAKEFHSNQTVTELWFPVIEVNLKANPEVSYPDGIVDFRLSLTNRGNTLASCSAEKLLGGSIHLVPGSLRVDGDERPVHLSASRYEFGEIAPGGAAKVRFQGVVSPFSTTRSIRGQIVIQYVYRLNGRLHAGEVTTNLYAIAIMHDHE